MLNGVWKKGFSVGIIMLCLIISNLPNIRGNTEKKSMMLVNEIHPENKTYKVKHVPACVKVGDLLLFDARYNDSDPWKRPGPYNEHGAIYIGLNETSGEDIFVEARGRIHTTNYSKFYKDLIKNLVFLRVKTANDSQRQAAVDWAKRQIGLLYQVFFKLNQTFGLKIANTSLNFPCANKLYCMELLWAAYYNQGIDIDRNGWRLPWWVTGDDIIYDDDIEIIYQEVNDSGEFIKPYKGVYIANRKIISPMDEWYGVSIFGKIIDVQVVTYNEKISRVDFYINNTYQANDTKPNNPPTPYTWTWNEPNPGIKVITAVAYDDIGNHYSTNITVWKNTILLPSFLKSILKNSA
jgi:hypothetical protein